MVLVEGVVCAFDMNMVPEAFGKKLELMLSQGFATLKKTYICCLMYKNAYELAVHGTLLLYRHLPLHQNGLLLA